MRLGSDAELVVEQGAAALEDREELADPEHVHPGGGKLDRQRQSVDPPGDLHGERGGVVVRLEPGPRRPCALEEQSAAGEPSGSTGTPHLCGDVQCLAARRHDPHPGHARKEGLRDATRLVEDVLAGVEDDERGGVAQPRRHSGEQVRAAGVEDVREQTHGVGLGACPGEVDEPDPVGEVALERARGLDREPALADTRRPDQRHETVLSQQASDRPRSSSGRRTTSTGSASCPASCR